MCKAPVKSSPAGYPNFLQAGCPSRRLTNVVKSTEERKYHIPHTAHLKLIWESSILVLTKKNAPGYLGEGWQASRQPSDASTPTEFML